MNIKRKRVLITGARAPVTLHLCRVLENGGMDVYTADSVPYALAKTTNRIKEFFLYPSPKYETKEFINCLIQVIKKRRIDILMPTCEETFYVSMYKEQLSTYCDVIVDDLEKMRLLHHKERFIRFVEELGLNTPKTKLLVSQVNLPVLMKEFHSDLVLKKVYSRFSDSVIFLKEGEEFPVQVFEDSLWIVQERIYGNQYCSYGFARNGKLLAHSVYKSEFTAGLGATLSYQYTEKPEIEQFVKSIVAKLSFTGQISFDFIVTHAGVAIPIECNPRATSGLHLFGKEIAKVISGEQKDLLYPKNETKEAIKLGVLLFGRNNFKSMKQVKRWFQILATYKDITFRKNDIKPFFYQFVSMYFLWRASRINKLTMLEQSTYDISWDGEHS
ncbi:ATP-grasp domain-containing protein [Metabacillus sp. FJAT-53654]|uniref:ATP-grasp domain-containing protein n=1 Tax=Metabacillus rhizosphaerae TaxID=3117747 RepID=A0ABZ2MPX4_9BACI